MTRRLALAAPLALAACVDFVAVEPPRPLDPSAAIAVRTEQEGDSVHVRLTGLLVGFDDPAITLEGVRVPAAEVGYDSLALELALVLPADERSVELALPFLPEGGPLREAVRIGVVRRDGAPSADGGDLLLPWDGPQVPDGNGTWTVVVAGMGDEVLSVSGSGSPARPLRLPGSLLGEVAEPVTAHLRVDRRARGADALYPLELHLSGHTSWPLGGVLPPS